MARSYITVVIAEPIVAIVLPQCTIATSQIVATYRCSERKDKILLSNRYNPSYDVPKTISMPITGFEPVTYALRVRCSTN